jgi:hypothetical protein
MRQEERRREREKFIAEQKMENARTKAHAQHVSNQILRGFQAQQKARESRRGGDR